MKLNDIFKKKIETHIAKNGIKTFGYKTEDLTVFTLPELKQLRNSGLIDSEDVTMRIMKEEFIPGGKKW